MTSRREKTTMNTTRPLLILTFLILLPVSLFFSGCSGRMAPVGWSIGLGAPIGAAVCLQDEECHKVIPEEPAADTATNYRNIWGAAGIGAGVMLMAAVAVDVGVGIAEDLEDAGLLPPPDDEAFTDAVRRSLSARPCDDEFTYLGRNQLCRDAFLAQCAYRRAIQQEMSERVISVLRQRWELACEAVATSQQDCPHCSVASLDWPSTC